MFTGIVEELGTVVATDELADAVRLRIHGALVTSDAVHGASIAVNGVCLTVVDHGDDEFTADVMRETLVRSSLGALDVGSRGQPRAAASRWSRGSAGTSCRGTSTAPGRSSARTPSEHWELVRVSLPDDLGALRRREGLDHGRRRLAHGRGRRARLVHRLAHPDHPRAHDARDQGRRRPREPRGRRGRQVRRTHAPVEDLMTAPDTRTAGSSNPAPPVPSIRSRTPSRPSGSAAPSSWSTTRTARTRATSSSPRSAPRRSSSRS